MAEEFFYDFGGDVAVTISPRGQGIIEVFMDGEKIYDKKAENNVIPNLTRVRKMKEVIRDKIASLAAVPADD